MTAVARARRGAANETVAGKRRSANRRAATYFFDTAAETMPREHSRGCNCAGCGKL